MTSLSLKRPMNSLFKNARSIPTSVHDIAQRHIVILFTLNIVMLIIITIIAGPGHFRIKRKHGTVTIAKLIPK